ncbi:hypothetical protein Rhopal_004998-T1 [Rhodotorula paludigena]|uniref:2-methylcitrate dehydratase n=1 Tax=Rhodotorula paludigena TaxID=86838 RepID=A0AAV5GH88_9BASI|nr:hypothetical protein Rhopal_004998-T1 [Rhodotorula paludigena]
MAEDTPSQLDLLIERVSRLETTVGTLSSSVARLETQNGALRTELARQEDWACDGLLRRTLFEGSVLFALREGKADGAKRDAHVPLQEVAQFLRESQPELYSALRFFDTKEEADRSIQERHQPGDNREYIPRFAFDHFVVQRMMDAGVPGWTQAAGDKVWRTLVAHWRHLHCSPRDMLTRCTRSLALPAASSPLRSFSSLRSASRPSPRVALAPARPLPRPSPFAAAMGAIRPSSGMGESTVRPPADKVMQDIADYVHNYEVKSDVAYSTARLCLIDTIGCGLEGLRVSDECRALMEPIVPGTTVPNGTKVPGTPFQMDPGHPSDNLGAILAVADYLSRTGEPLKMRDVLTAMIKAHEIQGCMALENSFNRVGLDHVILVKLASAAVVSQLLGLSRDQTVDVISQVFVDGQSLRTFRHAPNTGSRKSWSAGDACMRAVHLALQVKRGQMGIPTVLTAKTWGFYDVLFKGKEFQFQRPYGSYIMENVLFKISFPAEFHAQTAAEAAHILHKQLADMGKSSDDIKHVKIRTQEAAIRIIDKSGPLHNFADRDHTIQYMVAVPLIFGRLTTEDYSDAVAADPRIDALREKIQCVEDPTFTADYHDPNKRFISNALTVTLNDGTVLPEVHIDTPVGHKRRREEGTPLLNAKFERHIRPHFEGAHVDKILSLVGDQSTLEQMDVKDFTDLFVSK